MANVDLYNEWPARAVHRELRRGAWLEPGGSSGWLLVSPGNGFVPLQYEWAQKLIPKLKKEHWHQGWGQNVRQTDRVRYIKET